MIKPPCLNCKDRSIGCHSICEKFKDFEKKKEIRDKDIRLKKTRLYEITDFKIDMIRNTCRKKKVVK